MAQPVATLTLGGTDISSRIASKEGEPTLTYGRGASFDGAADPPNRFTGPGRL